MTTATAPGKIILLGEHAVVYGRPAIAVPVWSVKAYATVSNRPQGRGCTIIARDTNLHVQLANAPVEQPLALVARLALERVGLSQEPDWKIIVHSELPIAGGLGSGAALCTALVNAIFAHANLQVTTREINQIVYESERIYHGTPSGIDNTVITYGRPIWFVKDQEPETFQPGKSLHLLIADSGIRSPTKHVVGDVRKAWLENRMQYEAWFDQIAAITRQARDAIEAGDTIELGALFTQNHALLQQIGVSSRALDQLVLAAQQAGALGAKLSGGGRGGNVIALVQEESQRRVAGALSAAGAKRVIATSVEKG